ncbi:MAG: recombinase family protein [Luteolibacter sp.]
MKAIPVAILVRVSTMQQVTDRQVSELEAVAKSKGWTIIETIRESVSGSDRTRSGLSRALRLAEDKAISKVLVHEVSRVARLNSVAHDFVERLEELGVSLYWHSQAIETLLPDGKRNPSAAIMFALLAEMARAEKEQLVERINSGLAEARRKGKVLGRPVGSHLEAKELVAKHGDIARALRAGKSIRDTAARTGKGASTVKRVKVAMRLV